MYLGLVVQEKKRFIIFQKTFFINLYKKHCAVRKDDFQTSMYGNICVGVFTWRQNWMILSTYTIENIDAAHYLLCVPNSSNKINKFFWKNLISKWYKSTYMDLKIDWHIFHFKYIRQALNFLTLPWVIRVNTL